MFLKVEHLGLSTIENVFKSVLIRRDKENLAFFIYALFIKSKAKLKNFIVNIQKLVFEIAFIGQI